MGVASNQADQWPVPRPKATPLAVIKLGPAPGRRKQNG